MSSDIAYWTWESSAALAMGLGLNTGYVVILIGVGTPFWEIFVIRCGSW